MTTHIAHPRSLPTVPPISRQGSAGQVVLYSLHRAYFLWPLILAGFLGGAAVRADPGSAGAWGWAYAWVLLWTLVTLVFSLGIAKTLAWALVAGFAWVGSLYLEQVRHVPVLTPAIEHVRGFRPALQPGFALLMSWLLLAAWAAGLAHTLGRGRKAFTPNVVEEWFLGEGRELTDRSGLTFRTRYPDLFESIAGFGCGDLEAVDGHGNVVRRWEDLAFLFFRWRGLDKVLHERAVVENEPNGGRQA